LSHYDTFAPWPMAETWRCAACEGRGGAGPEEGVDREITRGHNQAANPRQPIAEGPGRPLPPAPSTNVGRLPTERAAWLRWRLVIHAIRSARRERSPDAFRESPASHDVPRVSNRCSDAFSRAPPTRRRERCRAARPASVRGVEFSRELRDDVLAGDITLTVRLWKRPQVKQGGRYRVGPGLIEVDAIELVPFAAITEADVRRAGEMDREALRDRAAHAGPIAEDTLVYRIELHAVSPKD
jgi:hypothetical protein